MKQLNMTQLATDEEVVVMLKYFFKILIVTLLLSGSSCEPRPPEPPPNSSSFEKAINKLTAQLLEEASENTKGQKLGKKNVMLVPFIDTATNTVVQTSKQIELLMLQYSQNTKTNDPVIELIKSLLQSFELNLISMELDNLLKTDYVMLGLIGLRPYPKQTRVKRYQVSAIIWDIDSGVVLSNQHVWLDKRLNMNPVTPTPKESAMYVQEYHAGIFSNLVSTPVGQKINRDYVSLIQTDIKLEEAENLYKQGNYTKSLEIYNSVIKNINYKEISKVYSALHDFNEKANYKRESINAFSKMISLRIAKKDLTDMRFYFRRNSTRFISGTQTTFMSWITEIGERFSQTKFCLDIEGYRQRSEMSDLSLRRAKQIQTLFKPYFKTIYNRTKVVDKGICNAPKEPDTFYRRVELKVRQCY